VRTVTAPRCPISEHLGSICGVVRDCHYNVCNALFTYHTLRDNGDEGADAPEALHFGEC
jgi:hypothetical protein